MRRKSKIPSVQEVYDLLESGEQCCIDAGVAIPRGVSGYRIADHWLADCIAEHLKLEPYQRTLARMAFSLPWGHEIEFTGRRLVATKGGKVTHVWTGRVWMPTEKAR